MDLEIIARNNHRNGMNCATAVYSALAEINTNKTIPPMPRSEGGKCGTVLAAEQSLEECCVISVMIMLERLLRW